MLRGMGIPLPLSIGNGGTNTSVASGMAVPAGGIGEFISQSVPVGSAVALTTGISATIASISLTAGTWLVFGNVVTNAAGTTTTSSAIAGINSVAATLPTAPGAGAYAQYNSSVAAGGNIALPAGCSVVTVAAPTTEYLVANVAFATSTLSAYGFIGAVRLH